MKYIFDILLIAVLLLCIIIGNRRGFVKTVLNLLRSVAAAVLAVLLGGWLSGLVYNVFIKASLIDKISGVLSGATGSAAQSAAAILDGLPGFIANAVESRGITADSLSSSMQQAGESAALGAESVIAPVIISVIKIFLVLILFFVLLIVLRWVINLIAKVFSIPGLRQIDRTLGTVTGLLVGILSVILICIAANGLFPLFSGGTGEFLHTSLDSSAIGQWILKGQLFYSVFK